MKDIALGSVIVLLALWLIGLEVWSHVRGKRKRQAEKERIEKQFAAKDDLDSEIVVKEWIKSSQAGLPTTLPRISCICSECDAPIWLGADYLCSNCRLTLV